MISVFSHFQFNDNFNSPFYTSRYKGKIFPVFKRHVMKAFGNVWEGRFLPGTG
jgi:hypothetical protein